MNNYYDYQVNSGRFTLLLSNSLSFSEREIHAYHEILYCADAHTVLHTENRQMALRGQNLLIIPKGRYHLIDLSAAEHFQRLKICIPDEVVGESPECTLFSDIHGYNVINLHTELLIRQISQTLRKEQTDKQKFYLASAVTLYPESFKKF